MDEVIDPAESISRFLRSSTHLRPGLRRPHYSAYMPKAPDGEVSVYRTTSMAPTDIASLGAQYVGRPEIPLKGHCDLNASAFFSEGLDIESVPKPHLRHANVRGWTADPKNRIIAKRLSDQASLTTY